jgi:hypothetical protein
VRLLRPALSLVVLAACGSAWDGLWLFQLEEGATAKSSTTCDENFTHARCPEAPDTSEDGPWTVTEDVTITPGLATAEILEGDGGLLWLIWGDKIVPLQQEGGDLTGDFTGTTEGTHEASHEEGYDWSYSESSSTRIVVSLTKDGDTWTGTIREVVSSTASWSETDEWKPAKVGILDGQINDVFVDEHLEAQGGGDEGDTAGGGSGEGTRNTADADDCKGDTCTGHLETEIDLTRDVTAWRTRGEHDPGAGTYGGAATPPGGGWTIDL